MTDIIWLIGAIALITAAHLIRVIRWEMFIEVYEKPRRKDLICATAVGYLLNYVIPFKLGDFVRAYIAGRKMRNSKSLGLSTVIVDRYLDIVSVGIIFIILAANQIGENITWSMAAVYIWAAIILLAAALLMFYFRGIVKRIVKAIAGCFNRKIEIEILQFSWALIWNFKDIFQKLSKMKLMLLTALMWGCYISSYALFAAFLSSEKNKIAWSDLFVLLFAQNGLKESTVTATLYHSAMAQQAFFFSVYMIAPLLILLIVFACKKKDSGDSLNKNEYLNLLPQLDEKERLLFLDSYFSDNNREYINNYLKINQGISIIRDFSAGSNATTMLCMDGEKTFFRKYAFGDDGEKLYQQIKWIQENADTLALPKIVKQEKTESFCFYDMPYNPGAVGLFEYAHSMPIESTWNVIRKTLESLEGSIYKCNVRSANTKTIDQYISSKVDKNLKRLKAGKQISKLLQYKTIIINGVEFYNLSYYEKYLTQEYLEKVFANDEYAVIHGDLTIENIICAGDDDFYIIDPNTGNIHDSPNLDYGKLLQSIHGGYEFLMTTKEVKVDENRINFLFTRSSAYMELHSRLKEYMQQKFGTERTRSIYFHEIIHWLRLMPYKIEKDDRRSVLFYAGMLMVMKDVIDMYGDL